MRGPGETSKDDVLRNWRHSGVEPATDTRVVEVPHVGILGYATFSDSFHDYARLCGSVFILPEHRRSEIENFLLDWIDNRAKESLRHIPPGK